MRILPVVCLAFLVLLAGCSGSNRAVNPQGSTGSMQFQMSLAPARALGIVIGRVSATLTPLSGGPADSSDLAISDDDLSASGYFYGLMAGNWRVDIRLYDNHGAFVAGGSDSIAVVSGRMTEATVVISFGGSAHISVVWGPMGDGIWDDFGQGAGIDGPVEGTGEYNGMLIVGGDFHHAGGIAAQNIAMWNGSSWSPLGAGIDGRVFRLTVYQGKLIAAGDFSHAGSVAASGIAAWDGASWSPLGSGLARYGGQGPWGNSLCVWNDLLIVGGAFDAAGGVAAEFIASWDGAHWAPLGSGMSGWSEPHVIALDVYRGKLIAGGWFTVAGGVAANRIASWDGANWSPLGAGMNSVVLALTVDGDNLYAVGDFTSPGSYAAVWNGATWAPLGSGFDSNAWSAAMYDGRLYVGGTFTHAGGVAVKYIAAWTGSEWVDVGGGVTGVASTNVDALQVLNGALYAGGTFSAAGGHPVSNIARWTAIP